MTRILVVDNYDSFVFTIVGYLRQLGAECDVVRNDAVTLDALRGYDGVLISPGPGTPEEAGASVDVIRRCRDTGLPMLGVCLGHQALGVVSGAAVDRAPELVHGKTSPISHDATGVFEGLPQPMTATRYHSLAITADTVPDSLLVNAWIDTPVGRIVMGVRHPDLPIHGVQFHPESVLTVGGHRLFANWLAECGLTDAVERSHGLAPLVSR